MGSSAKMFNRLFLLCWLVIEVEKGSAGPVSLSNLAAKHEVNVDLVGNDLTKKAENLLAENKESAAEIDSFKNLISEKSKFLDEQTSALGDQMQMLEDELMAKLNGLEAKIKDKEEQEHELKKAMDTLGVKDSYENNLGENIVPAEEMSAYPQWQPFQIISGSFVPAGAGAQNSQKTTVQVTGFPETEPTTMKSNALSTMKTQETMKSNALSTMKTQETMKTMQTQTTINPLMTTNKLKPLIWF